MRSTSLYLRPLVLVLLTLLAPRLAAAESHRVVLILAESEAATEGVDTHLLEALRGQLRELDVQVLVVRRANEALASTARRAKAIVATEHALGVVWLDVRPTGTLVFLYDSTGHLYSRDVDPDGSTVSQSESVAIILRSAIAAMLDGDSVGMTEVPLPPSAPAVPAATVSSNPIRPAVARNGSYLRAGISYVGTLFARRTPWQHGAAAVLTAGPVGSPWFLGLDYAYFSAVTLDGSGVSTSLRRHPTEVFGGAQLRVASVYFNVQGALSADYMVRTTQQVSDGLSAAPDSGRWLWAVSTRLGAMVPVSERMHGIVSVGADFLLNPFHQVVSETNKESEIVGSPLLARPRLELGLAISVW